MISPQLTARTLATLRGRFEALRGFAPMPAVMAEVPAGCDPEFKLSGGLPRPPIRHLDRDDLRYLGGAAVLCHDRSADPLSAPARHLWVACDPRAHDRLRHAFETAAAFAPGARAIASLAAESGARGDEDEWLWTLFEVAEKKLPITPLSLRGGHITVASGELHFVAHQVAAVRANPDRQDLMAKGIRRAAPAPTRYWQIDDAVEASLILLDLVDETPAAALKLNPDRDNVPDEDRPRKTAKERKERGLTTEQRLEALYREKPDFVLEATEKALAAAIGREPAAFTNCDYFQNFLKALRAKTRADIQNGKRRVNGAQKWGDFNSTAAPSGDADENH